MNRRRALTIEDIFAIMHRDLRAWNSQIPESPDRLDPVLRVMLEIYAHQLSSIDQEIGRTWEMASSSLVRSLAPECQRWPVPSYTVMQCDALDPVVEIDPNTRFFYKERREAGQTFFFSPVRTERVLKAKMKHLLLHFGEAVVDLSPSDSAEQKSASTSVVSESATGAGSVYVAIDYTGPLSNLVDGLVFMRGHKETLGQLRWGQWYPGSNFGGFHEDSGFCPGATSDLDTIFPSDDSGFVWGGLRRSSDIFKALENSFAQLPENFTTTWQPGPIDPSLQRLLAANRINPDSIEGSYYWVRIDLPPKGNRTRLLEGFDIHLDSILVINKNELRLFKHTGGNPLVEIEIPEDISTILEITGVVDSHGKDYVAIHEAAPGGPNNYYSLEDRGDRLVLWFDYSSSIEPPPDSITVTYAVTAGTDANSIAAGKIKDLYENHPGVDSAVNLIPTSGAIPAKGEAQILTEASSRLRNRDRALSFDEIGNWARTFDPRIEQVDCSNGVERCETGVRRCIVVNVKTTPETFHSEQEVELLRSRLSHFLRSRTPVNTQFAVKVDAQ